MRFAYGAILAILSVLLGGCGALSDSSSAGSPLGKADSPVARAVCGPGSNPETGLQGQVPLADRMDGRSQQGYWCNLVMIGQIQEQGTNWSNAVYEDCAYVSTAGGTTGVKVIDVSDPFALIRKADLTDAAMSSPHESMKANELRGLLAAAENGGPGFTVYDVATDCAAPRLLAEGSFDGEGHEGEFSPDGTLYYSSNTVSTKNKIIQVIDISDPTNPFVLTEDFPPGGVHGLGISDDGTRGYLATQTSDGFTGMAIMDLSAVHRHEPDAKATRISEVGWTDGFASQHGVPVTIRGRRYVIQVDELGGGALSMWRQETRGIVRGTAVLVPIVGGPYYACAENAPPFGMARVIDVTDESTPVVVSKLMLETNDPANCGEILPDIQSQGIFSYDSHYCDVDRRTDATIAACGYFNSGIRVFDIRDPENPVEIAYFIPPAQLTKQNELPGSGHLGAKNADWCGSPPRINAERGEIWAQCMDNGFMVLKFTNGVWPFK